VALAIERAAMACEALLAMRGREWHSSATGTGLHYADEHGELALPLPALPGAHQAENAALAIAMLHRQDRVAISRDAMAQGLRTANWPARLQRLPASPLTGAREVWVDGGHNPSAGEALARHFEGQRFHLILGMLANKDRRALLDPLAGSIASVQAVPVPGHDYHPAEAFGEEARAADGVAEALSALPDDGLPVLIAGSLYLAGDVLRLSGALPD
jgi:dihydrofolate synthase / folylpolyglutamate synthase